MFGCKVNEQELFLVFAYPPQKIGKHLFANLEKLHSPPKCNIADESGSAICWICNMSTSKRASLEIFFPVLTPRAVQSLGCDVRLFFCLFVPSARMLVVHCHQFLQLLY